MKRRLPSDWDDVFAAVALRSEMHHLYAQGGKNKRSEEDFFLHMSKPVEQSGARKMVTSKAALKREQDKAAVSAVTHELADLGENLGPDRSEDAFETDEEDDFIERSVSRKRVTDAVRSAKSLAAAEAHAEKRVAKAKVQAAKKPKRRVALIPVSASDLNIEPKRRMF